MAKKLDFNSYQRRASSTAIYPSKHKVYYPMIGLAGEVGELANKIKKRMRGDSKVVTKSDLEAELGDVLWYTSQISADLGIKLDDVARNNLKKLNDRKMRGMIKGSGDNR